MRRTLHDYQPATFSWKTLQGTESALAGAFAGLVSSVVTCPLDVVKTKLQAEGFLGGKNPRYRGLFDTIARIWSEEGVRGLYRGLGPTCFGYLPTWSIYFTCYDRVKAYVHASRNIFEKIRLISRFVIADEEHLATHIIAAMTAGATSSVATNPLWVIKTRFMTQNVSDKDERYKHTLDAIKRIYKSEGIPGFYRGILPSLLGVSHVGVQFPLYEKFKAMNRPHDGSDIAPSVILACSSSSKMIASVATYPHEVLRTRLQIQRQQRGSLIGIAPIPASAAVDRPRSAGISETCRSIWAEEGPRGFYRGLSVNLIRTVPSSALTILTYELSMRHLLKLTGSRMETEPA